MIPGFWFGKSNGFDFPYLIGLCRSELKKRDHVNRRSFNDDQDVIDGMAITSCFGWLNSLAASLGFTPYDELTYPLVTHAFCTDGRLWSFYVYQMNVHSFHSDVDTSNLKNICWTTEEMKLFESYENGNFVGLNEEVLRHLIRVRIAG